MERLGGNLLFLRDLAMGETAAPPLGGECGGGEVSPDAKSLEKQRLETSE